VNPFFDVVDSVDRTVPPLVPPRRLNYNAAFSWKRREYTNEFLRSGAAVKDMLIQLAGLSSDHRILDVGSGLGRSAASLSTYLSPAGSYHGIDMQQQAVAWCKQRYGHLHNFHFHHLNVAVTNKLYGGNSGPTDPEETTWDFPDDSFDFVFSVSLFTHLSPAVARRYVSETQRVLRRGGTAAHTFFVIDDHASREIEAGRTRAFQAMGSGFFVEDPKFLEASCGYDLASVKAMHHAAGLVLKDPIAYGDWTGGRSNGFIYQDVVVATKP
jgi:ubiquinone/menaquinone biosynthesis C-methylase UbiE